MKRYVQSHTTNIELGEATSAQRGMKQEGFDGITEVWFESIESLLEATSNDLGAVASRLLAEDEARFIDMEASTIFFTEEHEIFSF